jgi:hypothetical protein
MTYTFAVTFAAVAPRLVLAMSLILGIVGATGGDGAKPFPSALADAVIRDPDVAPCAASAHAASNSAYAAENFDLTHVTLTNGKRMSVVTGGGSCVCGNANCKVVVFEQTGSSYHAVLSDYGIDWKVRPDGTAVVTSHDSAAVVYRTSYRWKTNEYAVTARDMIYLANNVVKPVSRNFTFAPNTSSTVIRGDKVTLGFEDVWTFEARAGQTLTIMLTDHDRHFGSFSVRDDTATVGTANSGKLHIILPRSGRYEITIEGADESFATYALSVHITARKVE